MTTTHKHLSAEEKKARIDELQSRISDAVTSFVDTRNWEAWLKFVASFHTYSWRNQILIMSQNPYAVQVASFTAWKRHKRFVRKGEKGLRIFGGREIREEDPETGEVKERLVFFPVSVFDISQTEIMEGEEEILPPSFNLTGEDEAGLFSPVAHFLEANGWTITREHLPLNLNGATSHKTHEIILSESISSAQAAKTLIHEAAHVLMHEDVTESEYIEHRGIWETEAESVAYVVAAYFGFDTSGYSIPYIKEWSAGDEDLIKETAKRVSATAKRLIDEVSSHIEAVENPTAA